MQKQGTSLPVEYASFADFFKEDRWKLHMQTNEPALEPVDSLHHHDAMEIGLCLEGSGVFWIDGVQHPFSAPCGSLIYPGQMHRACSTGARRSKWVFITFQLRDADWSRDWAWGFRGGVFTQPRLLSLVEEVVYECRQKLPRYELCAHGLLEAVVLRYERDSTQRVPAGQFQDRYLLDRLRPVMQYIAGHYQEQITARTLCGLLHVHESTMRSWFQRTVGMSPMQYVQHTRVAAACSLLHNPGMPVGRIAQEVGYTSISSFNRQFESICGCSPSLYRRRVI